MCPYVRHTEETVPMTEPNPNPPDRTISNMTGSIALPRRNGELVFEEPWEGRVFGLAVALTEAGACEWSDFSERLIEETASDEQQGRYGDYYNRWTRALERLAIDRGLVTSTELEARTQAKAAEDPEANQH